MDVVICGHEPQRMPGPGRPNRGCIIDALVDITPKLDINAQPVYLDRGCAASVGEGATMVVVDTGAEIYPC